MSLVAGDIDNLRAAEVTFKSESGNFFNVELHTNPETDLLEGRLYYDTPRFNINNDRVLTIDSMEIMTMDGEHDILKIDRIHSNVSTIKLVNADYFENDISADLSTLKLKETGLSSYGIYELSVEVTANQKT